MRMIRTWLVPCLLASGLLRTVAANAGELTEEQVRKLLEEKAAAFHYQEGDIALRGGLATLKTPAGFKYLDAKDAAVALTEIWGNPKGDGTLGMLVPANVSLASDDSWAVVITYDEDGYVKDDDAEKIDYADLLKQMQEGVKEANQARTQQGFPAVDLVGWAESPRYDKAAHKMYWAKELRFGSGGASTLNYNIRMLGRRGVLVLNAVASMKDLPAIRQEAQKIILAVDFNDGHRYADFNASTDKVATYGLAALVAGGVAAKAGVFKLIWAFILAGKKLIIVAVIGIAALIAKLWKRGQAQA